MDRTDRFYTVGLCTKHPHDDDFDDLSTDVEYATLAEARAVFDSKDPIAAMADGSDNPSFRSYFRDTTHVWLLGPDVEEVRVIRVPKKRRVDDDWARERAQQAGMAFGCEGYNEAMGWD